MFARRILQKLHLDSISVDQAQKVFATFDSNQDKVIDAVSRAAGCHILSTSFAAVCEQASICMCACLCVTTNAHYTD